jgi:hypothetical protein
LVLVDKDNHKEETMDKTQHLVHELLKAVVVLVVMTLQMPVLR